VNVIIGYVVVISLIFGAFIIHGGNIEVILKAMPTELMAIFGGAFGAFVVGNQSKVLKAVLKLLPTIIKPSKYTKQVYGTYGIIVFDIGKSTKRGTNGD
jgi:chemotaxis protein MotA